MTKVSKLLKLQYLLLFVFTVFSISCSSDDDPLPESPVKNVHLVSHELVKTYTGETLKTFADLGGVSLPITKYRDVQLFVVKYNTTFQDKNIIASGLVAIPNVEGSFPILSYQNGTNTVNANAPSVDLESNFAKLAAITSSSGFVFVVPDYLGFGVSSDMFHPYMDKKSTVTTLVDMLLGVKELLKGKELKAKLNGDLYMTGYSQGGWATLALQKHLENKDLFTLKASSCGAGPHNLQTVIKSSMDAGTYENIYFLAYVFNRMYKMGQISQEMIGKVIKSPYKEKMNSLFDGVKTGKQINAELTTNLADLFTDDFLTNFETSPDFESIRKLLKEDSVESWKTQVPTRFYHSKDDVDILPITSKNAYDEMIALGADPSQVTLIELTGGHGDAGFPSILKSIEWFIELNNKQL